MILCVRYCEKTFALLRIIALLTLVSWSSSQRHLGTRHPIELKYYPSDPDVCLVSSLREYITRTAQLGDINEAETQIRLFVTLNRFNRPHKAASRDTLSRWVRNMMTAAEVDTSMYSCTACEELEQVPL